MSSTISHFYCFGAFAVDADQRVLLRNKKPVPMTPKVFETLLVLVGQSGRLVSKDELMNRLWPDSFVEEDNLTFNIKQLRRALGDDARHPVYIETVARRGYRFIADVKEVLTETNPMPGQISVRPSGVAAEAGNGFAAGRDNQQSDVLIVSQPWRETPPTIEESPTAPESVPAISSSATKRPFVIAAAVAAMLLLGTALLAWQFRNGANGNQNANRKAGGVPPLSVPALKVEKLTGTGKNKLAAISPDGKYVAYTSETKGRLWLRQLATGTGREIVSLTEGYIFGLAFAHSGEHLFFVKGEPEPLALYRVALPLGGLPAKLIEKLQGAFSLSPDDSQIAFIRYSDDDKECALMIADTDGGHERALAVHAQPDRFNTPAWSPDGQSIAVAVGPSDSGSQEVRIVAFNVANGAEKEVSADRWFHVPRVVWLPDQSGLIIVGERKIGETKQLWRISFPGGEVSQLTDGLASYADISLTADAGQAVAPQMTFIFNLWVSFGGEAHSLKRITQAAGNFCWTPAGQIIYSANVGSNRNLWVMQPDGTEQRQLTDAGENISPAVTPDGRYLVFTSNRAGALQVWRMNADGSNQIQLTSGKGVNSPAISPDGQLVIYNTVADWHLWKISIDGGEPALLTESFNATPSVSPDGKLIACLGRKDAKQTRKLLIIPFAGGPPLQEFQIAPLKLSSHRLQWTPDGKALLYAASRDGITSIYRQSLNGGTPEKLADFNEDDIFDFGYSPSSQHLAVTRGGWQFDVVLMSGFNQ